MASTRYGRIYHGDHHHNNIKFPSPGARYLFTAEFKKYHDSHEHDGEAPRFEFIKATDVRDVYGGGRNHNHGEITIDGYAFYEIKEYHNREHPDTYTHYRVPTCCMSPIIVLDREFVDSGTLQRHELSSVFGDMPETDFENLVKSVEQDGFMDSLIRVLDGKVLDGWHRYQAALSLNLVRKLMFMNWDEEQEGKAIAFVSARNLERRHLTASQRGQIVVFLNERFGWGGDRSKETNVHLKTQDELAQQANVSTKTIQRAEKVEKAGRSEEVIAGEKTSNEVITEETLKSLWEQVNAAIPVWKANREGLEHASKSMLICATLRFEGLPRNTETDVAVLKKLLELLTTNSTDILQTLVEKQLQGESLWSPDGTAPVETPIETPVESESAETSDDREARTLLKTKKQVLKSMWDARIQAARDYTGDGDTELNQYLTLAQLEKGFAKHHKIYKDPFKSGMKRITSAVTYARFIESALASDVSLEDLEKESRAISTYAYDILAWQRQDWIQQMLKSKKDAAAASKPEPEPDDIDALLEKVSADMPKWKERYEETGYKESDLVNQATLSVLLTALRAYRENEDTGAATVEELKDLLGLMKSSSYPFIRQLRKALGGCQPSESDTGDETPAETPVETPACDETDSDDSAEDTSLADLNLPSLKGLLDTLLDTVGHVERQANRDSFSVAIYETLWKFEGITEREQLSILIECALTLVSETETHA